MTGIVLFCATKRMRLSPRIELEQGGERGAIGGGNELDRIGGQLGVGERLLHQRGERTVGVEALAAAAEDAGVAGLQAEDGAVDGDVGARLVDDADDADGHAYLAESQAVGARDVFEDIPDRIGQGNDLADGLGELREAFFGERQAVNFRRREARGVGREEILLVGGEKFGGFLLQQSGQFEQRGVLCGGRRDRKHERRGAGALRDLRDGLGEIGGHKPKNLTQSRELRKEKLNTGRDLFAFAM
jgi:hypothetical protein